MNFKITHSIVLLAFCLAAVYAADINALRKEAIKRLDAQVANVKKIADSTSLESETLEGNIKIIGKHENEYGSGISESTEFQTNRNAKSAYMLAQLLELNNDVFRCIDTRIRETKDEIARFFSEKFSRPASDYVMKAEQVQRDTIKAWKDDYYKALGQYQEMYKRAVNDINKSTSESYIASVVKNFDQNSETMVKIIRNIVPNMKKIHVQILRILENLIHGLKEFSKYRIEKTYEQINQCFPRSAFEENEFNLLLL